MEDIARILVNPRTIVALGASVHRHRAGHYVPAYLHGRGYRIFPVNPTHAGETLFGEVVRASLAEIDVPVDIVNVFRRSSELMPHVDEILAMTPRPAVVWFQLGVWNDAAAKRLRDAGIEVVQDRCTMADHRRLVA